MNAILGQALQLTVLGMGMTFASIGALTLGMFLMTRVTRQRKNAGATAVVPGDDEIGTFEMTERSGIDEIPGRGAAQAAAAAVAVALADNAPATNGAAQAAAAAVAVALAGSGATPLQVEVSADGAWNGYVRSMQLSRRARYDARRVRG